MNPRDNVRAITQDRGVALASKNFEVNAPATVQARQTDSSGVLRAVNGFAQAYSEKRSKEAAEAVEEARAQGFLDESIGRVDESKIGTVDGYGEGVTARRTEAIGLRTVNAALQELDTAINDPEFDFETFRQDKLREMVEMSPEGQSPAARLQMAKVASQFDKNLRGRYEALAAKKRLEDGQRSLAENFSAFLDSGMQSGEQVTQWMATRGAESGFDDDEVKAVAGTILLSRLGMGDTKAYAMAEEAGLLVNPEMQAKFFQASQIAEAKAESARMDALKADVEGRTEAMMDIQRRLRAGTLDPAYALKIAERRPDLQGFVESALVQSVGIEIQRAEAAAQAAQAAERAGQLRALVAGGDRRAVLAAQLSGVTDKELKDTATSMVRESWLQSLSEDPEVQAAGRANIRFTVESLASAGLESPEVKRLFNSADPSNAAEFAQKVEIYRELEATPMRDYVRQQMDATTRASFDRYTSLVSAGKTPSQAAQEVATRRIAPEATRAAVRPRPDRHHLRAGYRRRVRPHDPGRVRGQGQGRADVRRQPDRGSGPGGRADDPGLHRGRRYARQARRLGRR